MNSLLNTVRSLYNADFNSINELGNSANVIYEMITEDKPVIIRVSAFSPDKYEHIVFEMNWLYYLSKNMSTVARPILSVDNNLYETVDIDGNKHIICAFEKAEGALPDIADSNIWNNQLFRLLGETMGQMHHLTKKYNISDEHRKRFAWYNDIFYRPNMTFADDPQLEAQWNHIVDSLRELPVNINSYGIIHSDFHQFNFFTTGSRITLFDFDDCICSWYGMDMMISVFHLVSAPSFDSYKQRTEFAREFLLNFLEGYTKHNNINKSDLQYWDLFLSYRRACTYKITKLLYGSLDDIGFQNYLSQLRSDVVNNVRFVDLDFSQLI